METVADKVLDYTDEELEAMYEEDQRFNERIGEPGRCGRHPWVQASDCGACRAEAEGY